MFLRYGGEWLRQVAEWLEELDHATQEQLRDPVAREALLASMLAGHRLRRRLPDLCDD